MIGNLGGVSVVGDLTGASDGRDDAASGDEAKHPPGVAPGASQVIDLVNGLTVRAKMGTARKTLLSDADEAADLVLPPQGTSTGPSGSARKARTVRG